MVSSNAASAAQPPTAAPPPVLRLRDLLRSEIVHDESEGDLLPSEAELMVAHQASRSTVRQALDLLRQEGVIARRQGVGTVVTSHVVQTRLIDAHGVERPETGELPQVFSDLRSRLLDSSVIGCPAPVAHLLGAKAGEPCARIEYVGSSLSSDGVFCLCTNYVLMPEGAALMRTPLHGDWYTYLEAAGLEVGDDDFLIGALTADEGLARRIGVLRGAPLLFLEQVIRDPGGRPFNAAYIYLRGDRVMLLSHAVNRRGTR
jgi:GntR family transcriptional regulator